MVAKKDRLNLSISSEYDTKLQLVGSEPTGELTKRYICIYITGIVQGAIIKIKKFHIMQDTSTDLWCSKISRYIMSIGDSIFRALERGLRSKIKRLSRDCLVAIAWLGCQISKSPNSLRYSACEILLSGIEQFLHPGMELEERLLACLCIYNYTSGKGNGPLAMILYVNHHTLLT